jgi:hypothetical protein
LWAHSDGELFGWLSRGIESPNGDLAMPGFGDALSDDQLWDLIDFVRAHNAGTTRAATGRWSPPIPAPGFQATCPDGAILSSDDLRGQIVRLIFAAPRAVRLPPWQYRGGVKVTPVIAHSAQDEAIPAGQCVVDDRGMARAYAIVTGLPEDALAGTQMLIDQNGWLRGVWRPDERDTRRNWNNPYALQPEIDWIVAHPIAGGSGGHHHH